MQFLIHDGIKVSKGPLGPHGDKSNNKIRNKKKQDWIKLFLDQQSLPKSEILLDRSIVNATWSDI